MMQRAVALFRRYAARHLQITHQGPSLQAEGVRITCLALRDGQLIVTGERLAGSAATDIRLHLGGLSRSIAPQADGAGGAAPFQLELPFQSGPIEMEVAGPGWVQRMSVPGFSRGRLALARAALLPGFALAGVRATPAGLRWLRRADPRDRARVKHLLGLDQADTVRPVDPAWLAADQARRWAIPELPADVTIILPVFNAFDLLPEVIDRIERNTALPWHLIVVEDRSTDPAVRPYLRQRLAAPPAGGRVTLLENEANLGFIGSVNRAFLESLRSSLTGPIVLLNGDAMLPPGWAERLLAPLQGDPSVASVTPMSNDAELMSVPAICVALQLRPGEAAEIDFAAQELAMSPALPVVPAGVGFCMALNRRFVARLPAFDTGFGRGYGEEVDWCQRAAALGGRHLGQPGLFVEHRGAASFGAAEKQALLRRNGAVISARYPDFDAQVQGFIGHDPLATPRLVLALAWADARCRSLPQGRVPVYLAHALGGGAERYLQTRIAADLAPGGAAVVLRVGTGLRWQVEVHSAAGVTRGGTDDTALMLRLMARLRRRDIVYSCGVGDQDPAGLPEILMQLGQGAEHGITLLFHDYLPISPAYTLLGADGVWRGLPAIGDPDPAHRICRPDGSTCDLAQWRRAWGALLARADTVTVFSDPSRALVAAAYPQIATRIALCPHVAVPVVAAQSRPGRDRRPVIGVLGNIGAHKGAAIVAALGQALAQDRRADLVLIGNLDPGFALAAPSRVHGSYDPADLPALTARYDISCWLIPSVWPETFSYVTHEALATGLPVWCFDLGAQAAAVRTAVARGAAGGVIALQGDGPDPQLILARMLAPTATPAAQGRAAAA